MNRNHRRALRTNWLGIKPSLCIFHLSGHLVKIFEFSSCGLFKEMKMRYDEITWMTNQIEIVLMDDKKLIGLEGNDCRIDRSGSHLIRLFFIFVSIGR